MWLYVNNKHINDKNLLQACRLHGKVIVATGRHKQWNGLLEWTTGLDYWIELFSFLGMFLCIFLEVNIFPR